MVHICIAIHDKKGNYSKYAAVMLISVFENTKTKICVHILHDDTLSELYKQRFQDLCAKYKNEILFYHINVEKFSSIKEMTSTFTIGTLFRLMLPQVLPFYIEKVLYMDVDIIANIDIAELWNIDIKEYYCAACKEPEISYRDVPQNILSAGLVDKNKYCNAGIILFNLAKIRSSMDLLNESILFLETHPSCIFSDQDAINYLFLDNIKYLDGKWNVYSRHIRNKKPKLESCIYHVSGDFIDLQNSACFDRLFLTYLHKLNWDEDENRFYLGNIDTLIKRIEFYRLIVFKTMSRNIKKVYWGCNSDHIRDVIKYLPIDSTKDYFVDSNEDYYGEKVHGVRVYPPDVLLNENKKNIVIIVVSKVYYNEIKKKLLEYGFQENEEFFNGIKLLSTSQGGYGEYY